MKLINKSPRIAAAVVGTCGIAAAVTISGTMFASAATPAARKIVVITCTGHADVKPSQYKVACADSGFNLEKLRWVSWNAKAAFATATDRQDACIPNCAEGRFYNYPVLVTLWRATPRPGHTGELYYSRITWIYTGSRSTPKGVRLPQTLTSDLGGGH